MNPFRLLAWVIPLSAFVLLALVAGLHLLSSVLLAVAIIVLAPLIILVGVALGDVAGEWDRAHGR